MLDTIQTIAVHGRVYQDSQTFYQIDVLCGGGTSSLTPVRVLRRYSEISNLKTELLYFSTSHQCLPPALRVTPCRFCGRFESALRRGPLPTLLSHLFHDEARTCTTISSFLMNALETTRRATTRCDARQAIERLLVEFLGLDHRCEEEMPSSESQADAADAAIHSSDSRRLS
ncbi:hypothetical protein PINS_up006387 [Pythium insidiosum]|nr:hypothetical protein PINS_up006387 [Pythium insidiosum]